MIRRRKRNCKMEGKEGAYVETGADWVQAHAARPGDGNNRK